MKDIYKELKEEYEKRELKNSFNNDFIRIEYDEKKNIINFNIIEEYSIIRFEISKKYTKDDNFINIYEYDDEYNKKYEIFSINSYIYENNNHMINDMISFFFNDILLIRYDIIDSIEI